MGLKMNSLKCPECGAVLQYEEGRTHMYCSYCGASIVITNENEHIYHTIDEAEIKKAEAEEAVQLKKLELLEKKRAEAARIKRLKIIISIVMGVVGVIMLAGGGDMAALTGLLVLEGVMIIWVLGLDKEDDEVALGIKVKVPNSIVGYERKNYSAVEAVLAGAGFTNIRCIPLKDLSVGFFKKPGTVETITINGKEVTSAGGKFSPDARVIISYHSFANKEI